MKSNTPARKMANVLNESVRYWLSHHVSRLPRNAAATGKVPNSVMKFVTDGFAKIGGKTVYARHVVKSYYVTVRGQTEIRFAPNASILKTLFGTRQVVPVPARFHPTF